MTNAFEDLDNYHSMPYARQPLDTGLNLGQLMGLLGALALGIGAFLPVVNLPLFGGVSYWKVSYHVEGIPVEGSAVVILAVMSLFALALRSYLVLWVTGVGTLVAVVTTFVRMELIFAQIVRDQRPGLEREVVEAVVQHYGHQFGWAVLAAGVILLLLAAAVSDQDGRR